MEKLPVILVVFICGLICLSGCNRKYPLTEESNGIVKYARYACGPACDAVTYAIDINGQYYVPDKIIDSAFRVQDLNVLVRFRRTGEYPTQWTGPTDLEKIKIISIRKR